MQYIYLVLNAQLPPANPEDISNIVFPEDGEAQVTIPASAIIHQRNTEGVYCHDICNYLCKNSMFECYKSWLMNG